VITPDVWDYVMPHWMEAVVNDVPENELQELKIILRYSFYFEKIFTYLEFSIYTKNIYHFMLQQNFGPGHEFFRI